MRSLARALPRVLNELSTHAGPHVGKHLLEALCQVEIGLHLQGKLTPESPAAHAWVLFSGHEFAKARGVSHTPEHEAMLRVGRYSMWTLRRRRAWREALLHYQRFDPSLRAFDVPDPSLPATPGHPFVATGRRATYDELLKAAPPLAGRQPDVAQEGPHAFPVSRTLAVVDLPSVPPAPLVAHDVDALPPGKGEPLTFCLDDLRETAAEMDDKRYANWVGRLDDLVLSTSSGEGFVRAERFTVDRVQHLLGIVGAGKSTLRDIIAVHLVTRHAKRVTIVVTDVAEVLKLVELYGTHTNGAAAPVLGAGGKEKHAQRLHRRLAGRGEHRLLAHDDPAFAHLSTSCVLSLMRRGPADEPLAFGEAPCTRLKPPVTQPRKRVNGKPAPEWREQPVSCPYWGSCPRHHSSRELVAADIWVATHASLLDSRPPTAQNGERIQYLELACRRSDLVIVDEVDRVQIYLDQAFAPAVLLAGGAKNGFIDELNDHKTRELSVAGRTQLSDREVEIFNAALNTSTAATDRLYGMLVADHDLRTWVRTGYFSAWTLQLGLLDERYPRSADEGGPDPFRAPRQALADRLDAFRDNPFGDRPRMTVEEFGELTGLLSEVLHTGNPETTRRRVTEVMDRVFAMEPWMKAKEERYVEEHAAWEREAHRQRGKRRGKEPQPPQTPTAWHAELAKRFEFTLLLCALEPKLALISAMWPRVEAALKLGHNSMYRRPEAYGPMVPEAPMGNLLGFQFRVRGQDRGGVRSGELTFFRCSGIGRELLRAMPDLATVDGRPGAHVLLMSASSWAGKSSRYHVDVPVGVIIEPPPEAAERIGEESLMRFEFVEGDEEGTKLRLSGSSPEDRPEVLRRMTRWLGASAETATHGGPLERELRELPDGRDQILLLVGSYEEARLVADTLHNLNSRWKDKVLRLVSDDEKVDDEGDGDSSARTLRRGDVEQLAECDADILVAPLLAVERGHNILNEDEQAAIGTVYFLARPNPHPNDLSLAVHSINDWIGRVRASGEFARWVRDAATMDEGAEEVRAQARRRWSQVLRRSMAWSRLEEADRIQVTWDMLVLMWQVIGRLVRGHVPARVVFVDAAFAPNLAADPPLLDTPESSLLHSVLSVLDPYLVEGSTEPPRDRFIVRALYEPLWKSLRRCLEVPAATTETDTRRGGDTCTE
ncbi:MULTISPECIES: hypothetical protein [unclassified Streptomyces]|uniref:pPIWI_RE_Z domain-containing protein n=1 Tax=unclassified Streptomyces TaxID=2593676 RepID=UPI0016603012|nr:MULTISPECIES: hypothetical protein [unclassified Streptomyces]MBD0711621.1 hypothetical protein [Streptomyces sp. CBMA291]MBD0714818.1 hypothetical protein [Streptomyces sp. CBMA370]